MRNQLGSGALASNKDYFNNIGISTSVDGKSISFLLEIAAQDKFSLSDGASATRGLREEFLREIPAGFGLRMDWGVFWFARRGTDYFPSNAILLVGEIFLKGTAALISAPYRWSINNFRQANGYYFDWLPLALVAGAVNLFVAQPLFFLGNVCNHVRGLVGGILRFGWGMLKGGYKAFYAPRTQGWKRFRDAIKPGLGEVVWNSFRLLGDAVFGVLCYGISAATGGVAAPFLVPVASAIQGGLISASASQLSMTVGMLATQGVVSQLVSSSLSAKVKRWVAEKFNQIIGGGQGSEKRQSTRSRRRASVAHFFVPKPEIPIKIDAQHLYDKEELEFDAFVPPYTFLSQPEKDCSVEGSVSDSQVETGYCHCNKCSR